MILSFLVSIYKFYHDLLVFMVWGFFSCSIMIIMIFDYIYVVTSNKGSSVSELTGISLCSWAPSSESICILLDICYCFLGNMNSLSVLLQIWLYVFRCLICLNMHPTFKFLDCMIIVLINF